MDVQDVYWIIPEDIQQRWASLVDDLRQAADGHGGYEMTFSIIVRQGVVTEILEPQYHKREPRGSVKNEEAKLWWQVIRRLQSVANGRSLQVDMRIDLDLQDNPTGWRTPDVRELKPRKG